MSEDGQQFASVAELVEGIRRGLVPRSIRLFAAQGLLPVTREELIRVLVLLVAEGDDEIAAAARATLTGFSTEHYRRLLELPELEPLELDLLARAVGEEEVWTGIVRHPAVADETLRRLARAGGARTQDAIVTNQRRLLGCLDLLADLRANPQVSLEVLRRVREFEDEFLHKATQWVLSGEAEPAVEEGPSVEEALAALRELGMKPPGEELPADQLPAPDLGSGAGMQDAFLRLAKMNTFQRIMQALKGSREERMILVRDRSVLVVRAVLESPKMRDSDVEQIAAMRSANEEALRIIAAHPRWTRKYGVVRSLVFNPKTPPGLAVPLVMRLTLRDLIILARDSNVGEAVRRVGRDLRDKRR